MTSFTYIITTLSGLHEVIVPRSSPRTSKRVNLKAHPKHFALFTIPNVQFLFWNQIRNSHPILAVLLLQQSAIRDLCAKQAHRSGTRAAVHSVPVSSVDFLQMQKTY
jgi:hypothetical protein